jgi:hypothetical protein
VAAAVAVTGLPVRLVEDAARVSFALSCEFEALLDGMVERTRQLPSVLEDSPQRCVHSVRGPVMWSETMTARANSFGDEDVFVCRSVRRSFDCAENRLLVWLLERGSSAGRLLRRHSGTSGIAERMDPGELRRAQEIGARARASLDAPHLAGIPARSPNRTELSRMRHARAVGAETSVLLTVRARARQPFTAEELASLCDPATSSMHEEVLETFRSAGGTDFTFACSCNTISCSGVVWRHPDSVVGGRVQPSSSSS